MTSAGDEHVMRPPPPMPPMPPAVMPDRGFAPLCEGEPVPQYVAPAPVAVAPPPPQIPTAAPQAGAFIAPPPKKRRTWLIVLVIAILVAVGTTVVVGLGVAAIRYSEGAAQDNVPVSAWEGQCFGQDSSKTAVACSGPHNFEVFYVVEYFPESEYRGRFDRVLGNELCDDEYDRILRDAGSMAGDLIYTEVVPTREQWDEGMRVVLCVVHTGIATTTQGSVVEAAAR
ncbi:MAG: septum formation family protein [Acidimicrobiales bacterium]